MSAQVFGKYQLLKKLATGGMAEVFLARHTGIEGFQRLLVVKRILPHLADDPEFVQMFLNEAKIAARFSHPNIAQIYDLGETDGTYFIAMEFVHGEDLGRVMRKAWSSGQWIARPLSIRIVAGACEGLHYAHSKTDDQGRPLRVVHRDISPQNILISFDGSVKLVDFGIAKAADQASLTKSGAIKGKFAYMSPEQAAGKGLDQRSDIFSVGLVLYELLTGVRPLKRDSELATLQAALECNIEPPSHVADVPEEMDSVVMKALSKSADHRYRDARAFQMALEEFLVSQRWVASSVQLSELMAALFSDRLAEEAKLGHPEPEAQEAPASGAAGLSQREPTDEVSASETDQPSRPARTEPKAGDDISWEAPPGVTQDQERKRKRESRLQAKRGTAHSMLSELVDDEAPPRSSPPPLSRPPEQRKAETAIARTPSRPEVPRRPSSEAIRKAPKLVIPGDVPSGQQPRETALAPTPQRESSSKVGDPERGRGARGSGLKANSGVLPPPSEVTRQPLPPELDDEVDSEPEALIDDTGQGPALPPPPKRSRSSGNARALQAPERRSRSSLESTGRDAPHRDFAARAFERAPSFLPEPYSEPGPIDEPSSSGSVSEQTEEKPKKRKGGGARWILAAAGSVALVLGILAVRKALVPQPVVTHSDAKPVFLTVDANLPVHIWISHHASEKRSDPVVYLGEVPLRYVAGAHILDTVVFRLDSQDVRYEQQIQYGEPGQVITLSHEFKFGLVQLTLEPPSLQHLQIHLKSPDGPLMGIYPPPIPLNLVEGHQTLVITGEQLKKAAEIEVEAVPGAPTAKRFSLESLMVGHENASPKTPPAPTQGQ